MLMLQYLIIQILYGYIFKNSVVVIGLWQHHPTQLQPESFESNPRPHILLFYD